MPFLTAQALQHTSNEVRVVALQTLRYVGKKTPSALEGTCLKLILPDLVLNTREKNTGVKAAAESTICSVLRLRDGDSKFQVKTRSFVFIMLSRCLINPLICNDNMLFPISTRQYFGSF